jgi:hypothetical protein
MGGGVAKLFVFGKFQSLSGIIFSSKAEINPHGQPYQFVWLSTSTLDCHEKTYQEQTLTYSFLPPVKKKVYNIDTLPETEKG